MLTKFALSKIKFINTPKYGSKTTATVVSEPFSRIIAPGSFGLCLGSSFRLVFSNRGLDLTTFNEECVVILVETLIGDAKNKLPDLKLSND